MTIRIYQKPTCSTCRDVFRALQDSGVDVESIDYFLDPIPKKKLKELLTKMNMTAWELLRTKEPIYRELKLTQRELTDNELIDLMVKFPDLIQRTDR